MIHSDHALKQWQLMYNETEGSEALAIEDQKLLGDACRDLRKAHGLSRNAISLQMGTDSMRTADIERRCSTETAKQYRKAVEKLSRFV